MNRTVITVLAIAFIVLAAVAVFGKPRELPEHRDVRVLFIALDGSDFSQKRLETVRKQSYLSQKDLASTTQIVLLPFANDVEVAYRGRPRLSLKAYSEKIRRAFDALSEATRTPGTRIDRVLEYVARNAPSHQSFGVEIHFDGGIEDRSEEALTRITLVAREIANDPNCKGLVLVGVQQRHRRFWEDLLGHDAIIRGEQDAY